MNRILGAAICLAGLAPVPVEARYAEPCSVSYQTSMGWSQGYQVECNYLTGYELGVATGVYSYAPFNVYAIVFWQQNQASVIQMQGFFACGMETSARCAAAYTSISGTDQQGRIWKVCSASLPVC